jgi:proline racemase
VQVEEVRTVSARDLEHVPDALGRDQPGGDALAVGQRVDHDRRPVGHEIDVLERHAALREHVQNPLLEPAMCGHGTIGVATVLVETGMVEVREPETVIRLDTPAGLVEATVTVTGGRADRVRLRNVPAFVTSLDAEVAVESFGTVTYDMAFGGNFYALVPAASVGLEPVPSRSDELIARGLEIAAAINASALPVHPVDSNIRGCKHVVFHAQGRDGADARNATAIHPGWLDRSPCGTGTSARMAALHARGELALGQEFVNESIIGSRFTGRLLEEVRLGDTPAVVPEVSGRAWITATGQYLLDPSDPFPAGFTL